MQSQMQQHYAARLSKANPSRSREGPARCTGTSAASLRCKALFPTSLLSRLGGCGPCAARGSSPHTQRSQYTYIFSLGECEVLPNLHSLLILSSDIETNPGPTYPCPVCRRAYSLCRGTMQCSSCRQWLCLSQHCSALTHHTQYTPGWVCNLCQDPISSTTTRAPSSPIQISLPVVSSPPTLTPSLSSFSLLHPRWVPIPWLAPPPLGWCPPLYPFLLLPSSPFSSPLKPSSIPSHSSSSFSTVPRLPGRGHTLKILQWNANGLGNKRTELKEAWGSCSSAAGNQVSSGLQDSILSWVHLY